MDCMINSTMFVRNIFLTTFCAMLSVNAFGSPTSSPSLSPISPMCLNTSISPIISPNTMNKINQELSESKVIRENLVLQHLVPLPKVMGNHKVVRKKLVYTPSK